jgi:hypothetical protein
VQAIIRTPAAANIEAEAANYLHHHWRIVRRRVCCASVQKVKVPASTERFASPRHDHGAQGFVVLQGGDKSKHLVAHLPLHK